ncbi:MAG: GDP-mannose 4,6-dehydratase [Bacteroidales bacterium]|nr:GDP-mannose 4,6-dehydratase [Bacteroidales bacterium]
MKILITGGCGFIGSHLCDLLLKKGHEITVLDDLSTGCFENVQHLDGNPNFHVIIDTVLNTAVVDRAVRECDAVYHLASAVGVKLIIDEPVKTIETIVGGTSTVLDACRRYRRRVLVASTSEVYGKGAKVPFCEDDDRVMGATSIRRWAYANAKATDEFLALAHYRETKLPVVVVRLFNTVGPRQTGQYGMVVPRFVKNALAGKPITVYDDGEQSRCFCHVTDVVQGLEKILLHTPKAFGEVVNLGNPTEVTINQLAALVKKLTKSKSEIIHISYEEAYQDGGFEDMRRRVPSIEKAKRLIGFAPKKTLTDIIRDVAKSLHQ